ncbi:FAD-dependent monooxygenase [Sorangium sp. So ce321]|uniref:FAD-dependent monooxygenase n=1 Tax=Sorangium sp. So ce321 TaxID=3133300 RepID=UPI003F6245F4
MRLPGQTDLREALVASCETDFRVHGVTWLSRFSDATRQAASYPGAAGVLLAGDAAHVHSGSGARRPPTAQEVQEALSRLPSVTSITEHALKQVRASGASDLVKHPYGM